MNKRHMFISVLTLIFAMTNAMAFADRKSKEVRKDGLEVAVEISRTRTKGRATTAEYEAFVEGNISSIKSVTLQTPEGVNYSLSKEDDDDENEWVYQDSGKFSKITEKYPNGAYIFTIELTNGETTTMRDSLTGAFPAYPKILSPKKNTKNVSLTPTVKWTNRKKGIVEILLGIEPIKNNDDDEMQWEEEIDGKKVKKTRSIQIPANVLQSGTRYSRSVEILNKNGKISEDRVVFTTATE